MKNSVMLCLILSTVYNLSAQRKITITEGRAPQSGVSKSFTTTFTQVDLDFTKSSWVNFLNKLNGASGAVTKNGDALEIETEHVALPALDGELVDIIAILKSIPNIDGDDAVSLTIDIERENNTTLSPDENEAVAQKIKLWLFEFDNYLYEESIARN